MAGPLADRLGSAHRGRPPPHAPLLEGAIVDPRLGNHQFAGLDTAFLSGLAIADWISLVTIGAARLGMKVRVSSASLTFRPRTRSTTGRTLRADIGA